MKAIQIKLGGNRKNSIVRGVAIIDYEDADLAGMNWSLSDRYAVRVPKKGESKQYLHRVIAERKCGRAPARGEHTDHINGDPLDNTRGNLRIVSCAENGFNRKGATRLSTNGVRGVCWVPRVSMWRVRATLNKKIHEGGYFDTLQEAETAAIELRKRVEESFAISKQKGTHQ